MLSREVHVAVNKIYRPILPLGEYLSQTVRSPSDWAGPLVRTCTVIALDQDAQFIKRFFAVIRTRHPSSALNSSSVSLLAVLHAFAAAANHIHLHVAESASVADGRRFVSWRRYA